MHSYQAQEQSSAFIQNLLTSKLEFLSQQMNAVHGFGLAAAKSTEQQHCDELT